MFENPIFQMERFNKLDIACIHIEFRHYFTMCAGHAGDISVARLIWTYVVTHQLFPAEHKKKNTANLKI